MLRRQRAIEIVPSGEPCRWRRYDVPQHLAPKTSDALRFCAVEGDLELLDRRHRSTIEARVVGSHAGSHTNEQPCDTPDPRFPASNGDYPKSGQQSKGSILCLSCRVIPSASRASYSATMAAFWPFSDPMMAAAIRLGGASWRPRSGHATGMGYFQLRLLTCLLMYSRPPK
jgi:hypothetical protein